MHRGSNEQRRFRDRDRETFTERAVKVVGLVFLAVIALWLTYKGLNILLTLFGGIVMAVLLHTLAEPFVRWTRMPVWAAVMTVTVLGCAVLAGAGCLLAPSVSQQFEQLGDQLPAAID